MRPDSAAMRARWLLGALAFAAAAASLAGGSGFDLDPFDSAELALAAVTRGLAHPPGQPLHTLLGWLATRLPFRPLAVLAWLSIAPAAVMPALAATRPMADADRRWRGVWLVSLALVFAALPSVRSVACRVEVYPLAACLALVAVVLAGRQTPASDFGAGVLLGLSAAVNPVMAAQGAGAFAKAWRARPRDSASACARIVAGGIFGLLPYSYAAAVGSRATETLVWGAPHDAHGWMRLLTAADFRRNVSASPGTLLANAAHLARDLAFNGALVIIAAGAIAAAMARTRERRDVLSIVVAFVLGAFMIAANVPYLPNNPDYGGYLLVPLGLAVLALAGLPDALSARASRGATAAGLTVALAVSVLALLHPRPSGATRALATEALAAAPPHAIVVLGSDHLLFPALYLQRVEGLRRDVTILNPGWASARWAWTWAHATDPSLQIDLSPGLGGSARLEHTLRTRSPGRAVLAESPAFLQTVAPGGVCVRGVLWSSSEGCIGTRRWLERTRRVLAQQAQRARDQSWDARVVQFTARSMGDAALPLGCSQIAAALYRAGLGSNDTNAPAPRCDGTPRRPPTPAVFLDITSVDLDTALTHLAP